MRGEAERKSKRRSHTAISSSRSDTFASSNESNPAALYSKCAFEEDTEFCFRSSWWWILVIAV